MTESISSNLASIVGANQVLLQYFSVAPDASAQTITSDITSCKCYISTTIALQTADNGTLYLDYYSQQGSLLHSESIVITSAPTVTSFVRYIESKLFGVRLVLSNPPSGTLGLFVSLRKKYA